MFIHRGAAHSMTKCPENWGLNNAAGGDHKKTVKPAQRRELVKFLPVGFQVSERRACRVIPLARSSQRYRSQAADQRPLRVRLRELAYSLSRQPMWRSRSTLPPMGTRDSGRSNGQLA